MGIYDTVVYAENLVATPTLLGLVTYQLFDLFLIKILPWHAKMSQNNGLF